MNYNTMSVNISENILFSHSIFNFLFSFSFVLSYATVIKSDNIILSL